MKPEIDDVMRYLIRMERKLDVLLAVNRLYVDPETLEVNIIEEEDGEEEVKEETKKESKDIEDIEIIK